MACLHACLPGKKADLPLSPAASVIRRFDKSDPLGYTKTGPFASLYILQPGLGLFYVCVWDPKASPEIMCLMAPSALCGMEGVGVAGTGEAEGTACISRRGHYLQYLRHRDNLNATNG